MKRADDAFNTPVLTISIAVIITYYRRNKVLPGTNPI